MSITPAVSPADIAVIARLAHEIWNEHYVAIIGQAQVDYMVDKFQSTAAIDGQIRTGHEYFLLRSNDAAAKPLGYCGIRPEPAEQRMFLSKLYVLKGARGHGAGKAAVQFIEALCKARGFARLSLTVNKFNPALDIYRHLGFATVESIVSDIGGGYVMDDYRMEKSL
jgi:GNAT superfamily N-acetyltransferase